MAFRARKAVHRLKSADYLPAGRLPLEIRFADVNRMVPPHDHEFFEIALVTRGRGEHYTSRRRVLTAAGDVWVMRPGHWHTYMNVRGLGVYNCLIGSKLFRSLTPVLRETPGLVELFWRGPAMQARDGGYLVRLAPVQRQRAADLLDAMAAAQQKKADSGAVEARGNLLLYLSLLAEAVDAQAAAKGGTAKTLAQARVPAGVAALDILETLYADDLTVADLAREVGLSAPHLTRVVRALTGLPPMRYLAGVRAQRACALLAGTARSITAIGATVGWADPNLFARRFRQQLGVSPTAYRKLHAEQRP
ncbi:MAG: AraC family transcriptional regulator [Planctomycetes bacterium]|nr:AraC family transcriptional regulator [Planctomycetota bacterium]